MSSRSLRVAVVLVVVVSAVLVYRWWASDERAIRRQMTAIAEALTVRPEEGSLGAVTRVATLRNALAPDIRLSAGPPPSAAGQGTSTRTPPEVVGRDAVLGLVGRWLPPPGGVTVEFVDRQVIVDQGGVSAEVYCTATIEAAGASGQPTVDARELIVGFQKLDGDWLISSVRVEETLMR
jgi:hypothetical protein